MVFVDVLLPVFLVGGVGYAFGRLTRAEVESLTKLAFYVLSPALIFHSLYTSTVSGREIGITALFVAVLHLVLFGLALLGGRFLSWESDTRVAAALSLSNNNAGSYGLSVLLFAFGENGFALGVVYMLALLVFQTIFGVGIASWKEGTSVRRFVLSVLKVPWFHALGLALILRGLAIELPTALLSPIKLVAQAAIPVFLLLLGIQLSRVKLGGVLSQAASIAATKLLLPPLLAFGLTAVFGVGSLLRAVLIIEASTPTAINTLILALKYQRRPDLVAFVVFLTTVGSVLTMGIVLALLV